MNWTFLVADSTEAERTATVAAVQRFSPGATIWSSSSGAGALALLEERRTVPSLVLLDMDMGDMTGLDLLGELRLRRWLDRAPVIFASRPMSERLAAQCYRLGVLAVLAKPLSQYELRHAVREFAREARVMTASTFLQGATTVRSSAA